MTTLINVVNEIVMVLNVMMYVYLYRPPQ